MAAMYWTHAEIQELLEVTLKYKEEKCRQNIDWRSHPSTYEDIWRAFVQVYPVKQVEKGVGAFQHNVEAITKTKVIFKLKDMQKRFNMAWQSDGAIFYAPLWDICNKIWGEKAPLQDDGEDENLLDDEDSQELSSLWDSDCSGCSTKSEEEELECTSPPCKRKILQDNYFDQEYREESIRIHQELIEGMKRYQSTVIESMRVLAKLFKTFPHLHEQAAGFVGLQHLIELPPSSTWFSFKAEPTDII